MKHTPGPWNDVIHDQSEARLFTHDHRFIARISGLDLSRAEDRANVRLIAAAPEMLYALKMAADELNKMGCECDCEPLPVHCPVCAVRTAINKATQES